MADIPPSSPRPGILRKDSHKVASPSSLLGVNAELSPASSPQKSVSIAAPFEIISPLMLGRQKSVEDFNLPNFREGRKFLAQALKTRTSPGRLSAATSPALKPQTSKSAHARHDSTENIHAASTHSHESILNRLIEQVGAWVKDERVRRARHKPNLHPAQGLSLPISPYSAASTDAGEPTQSGQLFDGDGDSLTKLEQILKQTLALSHAGSRQGSVSARRKSSIRKLRRKPSASSDTDYIDGDILVPSCDVVLDNSKTLSYTGGVSDVSDESSSDELTHAPSYRDHDAWAQFKFEIVRLAQTLRLKGWRKVPLELSGAIVVQRLSGALTNAVYVVSPPTDIPLPETDNAGQPFASKRPPIKLLLRIYGPQVEHLIDREAELAILRRLARKQIGPRLLGTFANGRFEEFFNAKTLTSDDLRNPDTSKQIAKRMRELHEGIDLLPEERDEGPFVWRNWDKWLVRAGQIVCWMDDQIRIHDTKVKPTGQQSWMRRGFICGVPWADFRAAVEKYRSWLDSQCGGCDKLRDQLVFAHNDTQYGNLLRLVPTCESPLLLPANTHRQLVVIDFEYSSANTPGLEFANHFTEWCYNYHDKRKPYACNQHRYPTPEEQERFVRAYVQHRPHYASSHSTQQSATAPAAGSTTPGDMARRPTTTISEFMLDARNPRAGSSNSTDTLASIDASIKAAEDAEIARLLHATRLWRLANSAQWVAWGIVQAKVPGMPAFADDADSQAQSVASEQDQQQASTKQAAHGLTATEQTEDTEDVARELLGERADEYKTLAREQQQGGEKEEEEQDEFDYLGYTQHRAMLFWGDAVQLGIVKLEDLPAEMKEKIKTVPY